MTPRLRLAYIEDTACRDDEIVRTAGRIAALYLYDERHLVYCCEMTASYAMLGYLTEHHVSDAIQMAMRHATDVGSISYVHAGQVDGFARIRRRPGFRDIDPFVVDRMPCTITVPGRVQRDHDQAIAEMLAYLHSNGFTTI